MRSGDLYITPGISRLRGIGIFLRCLLLLTLVSLLSASAVSADDIASRAAVVMDAATGRVLFAKNPDLRLMPASTTKLMTALVVVDRADVNDVVTVSARAALLPPLK